MQPLISVIIPVYNTSLAVRRLLVILFGQTYENLEIICIDDGSTDDSLEQLKKLAKYDRRLKVFHQENRGASAARNLGLDHATGDYIAFLDSDDLITRDYFDLMLNALSPRRTRNSSTLSKTARAFSVCGFHYFRLKSHSQSDVFIDPIPEQRSNEPARAYLLRFMREDGRLYSAVNKLFRAEIINTHHLRFDVDKNFAEDTKFVFDYLDAWLKTQNTEKVRLGIVPKPLYIYNFGTETSTVKKSSLKWQNWLDSLGDFEKFAAPLSDTAPGLARKRLKKLKWRFQVSHALAVARAPISKAKKLKYLKSWQLFLANLAIRFRP